MRILSKLIERLMALEPNEDVREELEDAFSDAKPDIAAYWQANEKETKTGTKIERWLCFEHNSLKNVFDVLRPLGLVKVSYHHFESDTCPACETTMEVTLSDGTPVGAPVVEFSQYKVGTSDFWDRMPAVKPYHESFDDAIVRLLELPGKRLYSSCSSLPGRRDFKTAVPEEYEEGMEYATEDKVPAKKAKAATVPPEVVDGIINSISEKDAESHVLTDGDFAGKKVKAVYFTKGGQSALRDIAKSFYSYGEHKTDGPYVCRFLQLMAEKKEAS